MNATNLTSLLCDVMKESRPYRLRFGSVSGVRLWLSARNSYKLPRNSLFSLKVPGVKYPVWLRSGTSDIGTFKQVVCDWETEFQLEESPSLIIDAGANIGLFSLMMAVRYPRCKIIALEVERANFDILCRNVANYRNITAVQKALWKSTGHVRIVDPTVLENAFTVVEAAADDPGAIPATSVDELIRELGCAEVSLLKMDIEGSEREVLDDNSAAWMSRIKAMLVELHDRFRPGCADALRRALAGRPHQMSRHGEYRLVKFC